MKDPSPNRSGSTKLAIAAVAVIMLAAAGFTYDRWLPSLRSVVATDYPSDGRGAVEKTPADDAHAHARDDSAEGGWLKMTELAWKNIGLTTDVVRPASYVRTVSVPAIVVERPGRSQVEITAPFTSVVTRIYAVQGEAIEPGQSLFDLRLTHEDLVTAQESFLRLAQELEVVQREIARLQSVEGVIAGRRVIEKDYERQKIDAALVAQRQGLLLHGLTGAQVEKIRATRQLLQYVTLTAPPFPENGHADDTDHVFNLQKLNAMRGEQVTVGSKLATLADHCVLYVEAQAFEDDANRLLAAAAQGTKLQVSAAGAPENSAALPIHYVADQIDPASRALRFYLLLPNTLVSDDRQAQHRFVSWQYRPGQRMQVHIPLEQQWTNQLVLPPDAVVVDGAEAFVFEQNGDFFVRRQVHVLYRGQDAIVVDNDGSLVGATLAISGAYQMHLALKNRAGGGVDPHAGHNH